MKVLDSDKNPQFKIFLFQDSKEIRNAVDGYLAEREVWSLLANSSKSKLFFSDIIGDKYKLWDKEFIILDGGTGSGKTYFIQYILIPYAEKLKKSILYLCNRRSLYDELLQIIRNHEYVELMLYQVLQEYLRNDKPLGKFDYIIADECHYLYGDALFNEYTDLSHKYLLEQKNKS